MSGARGKAAVLSVGRLYADLIFTDVPRLPSMGTEVFAGDFALHPGGGAFITAAHLAALGNPAALAAMLPPPPYEALIASGLSASGVSMEFCRTANIESGPQLTVAIVGASDRAFLTKRAGPSFPPDLNARDVASFGVKHIHVGELGTLVERPDLIGLAHEVGATLSLDCGWDDELTANDITPLLGQVDVFLPNDAEAANLHRLGVTSPFAPLTVIKMGARGAEAHVDGKTLSAPAAKAAPVDTTGAGDAFNAGFLSAWLEGRDIAACLAAGNRQGALAIMRRGGFQPPVDGSHRRELAS